MNRSKRLRFQSSLGDWFDAPAAVRLLTAMLFLLFIHAWYVAQSVMIYPSPSGWRAFWIARGESPVTLAGTLIAVLGAWTVLLIVDGYAVAMNGRQRFRSTRVGLYVMLAVFFLVYAVSIFCHSATSCRDEDVDMDETPGVVEKAEHQFRVTQSAAVRDGQDL
jgi:hypothetical protein